MGLLDLNSDSANKISFKKLVGKAHTQEDFQFYEESQSSNVSIGSNTIFGENINRNPTGLTSLYDTDGIIEKIKFEVEIIPNTKKASNNQSQGYRLKLPSDYVTSGGSKSGEYSAGTILYTTLGDLQIVPSSFGNSFKPILYQTNGTTVIEEFDTINWILDPYSGIIFVQDPPNNYDASPTRPGFVEAFMYVGKYVDEIVSSAATAGVSTSLFNSYTGSTNSKIDFLSAQTSGNTIISNNKQIIFNNSGTVSGNSQLLYEYAQSALTLGTRSGGTIGDYSLAHGCNVFASGNSSHAEGENTMSINNSSHAEGFGTKAIGLQSHAEGCLTCSIGKGSHAEGRSTRSCGCFSHAEGLGSCSFGNYSHAEGSSGRAIGLSSHAEGGFTYACGNYSHAEGRLTKTYGNGAHSEGVQTYACGNYSHAEGSNACAIGNYSHAEGNRTKAFGIASHSQGCGIITKEVIASGSPSFNFSINNAAQIGGHGALATSSAILGGANHNIAGGNTGATILGGCGIKLTGTTYINYTAVGGLAIFTTPTTSSTNNVLVWDSVDKKIKINTSAGGSGGTAICSSDKQIIFNNSGTVSGNSQLLYEYAQSALTLGTRGVGDIGTNSFSIGLANIASGSSVIVHGSLNIAGGKNSHAEGLISQSIGMGSHAEGCNTRAIGNYSHAEGGNSMTSGACSHAEGSYSKTCISAIGSHAEGCNTTTCGSFSHAEGRNSISIGLNSHAEGFASLSCGASSHSEGAGSCSVGVGSHAEGGGTKAIGTYSHSEGCLTISSGNSSHAEGINTCAIGNYSHAEGNATYAIGSGSHAEGLNNYACGDYSHAEGNFSYACGDYSHAEGASTHARGNGSHAEGTATYALGNYSHAEGSVTCAFGRYSQTGGRWTMACGNSSKSSGYGTSTRFIIASGCSTFNHSQNNASQVIGHGALANNSAILGGINHNIQAGNNRAVILGGNAIKLTGGSTNVYQDFVAVPNLAIFTTPATSSLNNVLVWDSVDKKVKVNTSAGGSGGTSICSSNKQIIFNNSGTVSGNSQLLYEYAQSALTLGTRGVGSTIGKNSVAFGSNVVASGTSSFAQGSLNTASGLASHAEGDFTCSIGCSSHAEGKLTCSIGKYSHAEGLRTCSKAYGSHSEGYKTVACNRYSHAEGYLTKSYGVYSHAEGGMTKSRGVYSHAEGVLTESCGCGSHSEGYRTIACGNYSKTSGMGFSGGTNIIASGLSAFNHSTNDSTQISGHGANAHYSVILGGKNHNIEVGNTGATIFGGSYIKLTGTNYIDTVAVANLAIFSDPLSGVSSDQVLVWNSSDKKVKRRTQSDVASTSDKRLKTNIQPINNALDSIKSICGYTYLWNDKYPYNEKIGTKDFGLIAQELEQEFPEMVTNDFVGSDGEQYKAIKLLKMIPVLVNAIKELEDRVKFLENK